MNREVKNTHTCILCGYNSQEECSYLRFPSKEEKKTKWLSLCGLPTNTDASSARLCSKHFRPEDFSGRATKRRRLNGDAIPSIFFPVDEISSKHKSKSQLSRWCIICKARTIESTARFPQKEMERNMWMEHFNIDPQTDMKNTYICTKHFYYHTTAEHQRSVKIIRESEQHYTECDLFEVEPETSASTKDSRVPSTIPNEPILILATHIDLDSDVDHATDSSPSSAVLRSPSSTPINNCSLNPTITVTPTSSQQANPKNKSRLLFPRYPEDIKPSHLATSEGAKRCLDLTRTYIRKQRVQITTLQQQLRRARHKIRNLEDMVIKLREDNSLNEDQKETFMVYL